MTDAPKNFVDICAVLEVELSNLASLASVMLTLLQGELSRQPVDGYHQIGHTEGDAIRWAGDELATGIQHLFSDFLADYGAALKAEHAKRAEAA
jgi:hypothetical protein